MGSEVCEAPMFTGFCFYFLAHKVIKCEENKVK